MCQLEDFGTMAGRNSIIDKIWQLRKRVPRWTKNRLYLLTSLAREKLRKDESAKSPENSLNLHPGDTVRVRSKEEIQPTLDGWKKYKGCTYMKEMWEYCGGTYKVFKKVDFILDERDMKIKKCKNMVILEGLICQGSWPFNECDRCCFFFWKEAWLERVT